MFENYDEGPVRFGVRGFFINKQLIVHNIFACQKQFYLI
jgi:hypothetical protein